MITEEVLVAKLHEVLTPLSEEIAHVATQQEEELTTLRELWSEMKQIARRLNQLDGKWM